VGDGWVASIGNASADHPYVTGPLELGRLNSPSLANSRGRDDEHRLPTFYGLFPTAHGNNFAVRRDLWDEVGGSDESIVKACEDVELSLRLWLAGVHLSFEPGAVVHYRYREKPAELFRQGVAYGEGRPLIARRLLDSTGLRPARGAGWRSWAWLVAHLPDAVHAERRAAWVWVAGNRWGHVRGSAQNRLLLL
jgi:GT2 family glycosyltransferase